MKHALYLLLVLLALWSCQTHDDNAARTEADNNTTADTATSVAAPATPEPPAAPDSAFLIIPGESIGQVHLNMTAEELGQILGKPDSGDAAMGKALSFWISKRSQPREYVAVYTVNNFDGTGSPPKVKQVQVTSPQFRTSKGIGTGMSLPRIRETFSPLQPLAYYTNEQQQQVYIFDNQAQGIAFEVTVPDSTCTAITVNPAGEDVTNTYLPVHPDLTRLQQH